MKKELEWDGKCKKCGGEVRYQHGMNQLQCKPQQFSARWLCECGAEHELRYLWSDGSLYSLEVY